MSSATAWNVRGVGRETRAFAEEAARRAGMSLGDWLDEVVADKAAEQGLQPADLDRDDRLDAIGERISRLARREERPGDEPRPRPRDDSRRERSDQEPRRDEVRRADELLEAAIARIESRAERTEARAARAFETVAQWIERNESDRGEERATLKAVAEKLAAIDQRTARQQTLLAEAPRRLESRIEETERDIDARMSALSRRVEAAQDRPRPLERPRIDLRDAVSQIARRRSELDARAPPSRLEAEGQAPPPRLDAEEQKRGWRNFGVDPASAPRAASVAPDARDAPAQPPVEARPAASAPAPADALREEIKAVSLRIDQMRREQSEQRAQAPADIQGLRAELAAMSRSLADLAPRNAVVALEGAMRDLSDRIATMRDNGVRETLVALIGQLRDALRAHDPQAAVRGLEREIRAIDAKVDAIAQGVINPEAFERIRAQTEEVRNLLAAAAMRPVPVERLERQIGDLADRVEQLAASPAPQAETARFAALLADARAQIERSTPAAALSAIERRLEQLAERIDQAVQRPEPTPAIDARAIEDLARRIDGVRASVERQTGSQPDTAKLEATLRDINQKLDRPVAAAASSDALAAMFQDLSARIEQRANPTLDIKPLELALRTLGDRPIEIDTTPIENLMRDLGARLAPPAVDMRPLETLLREINQKLDRGPVAATAPGEIKAMIHDLGARLDQRVDAAIDTRPLEEALRALHDRIDLGAATRVDPKFVEQAADLLAERLGSRDSARVDADALANQISEIHDRLDALHPDASSSAALERKVADLLLELDATRRALQTAPAGAARSGDDIADGLANIRAEQSSADKRTQARLANLQDILEKIVNRLGRVEEEVARVDESARTQALAGIHVAPRAEPPGVSGATLRDIPDRAVARPTRDGLVEAPRSAAPRRSIDGSDFLLEPGAALARARSSESSEPPTPKSAINAHIAAARRAAQAALAETAPKDRTANRAAETVETSEPAQVTIGAQAKAFLASRRRPLLLAATLLVVIATFAIVELRGPRQTAVQRSDLEAPARAVARSDLPKLGSLPAANNPAALDRTPLGSISAPPAPARSYTPPPADLMAAIPAGLTQSLRDAAAAGDPQAEFELGLRLVEGRGIVKDPHAAAQWFEQAAVRDLPVAEYRLATLYEKGVGVTRDLQLAMSWYKKAAAAGNARAMHNLAVINAEGVAGGKPDYAEAAQWFGKAGQLGIRDSQYNLGILYARGMGVPQDLGQSWLWFSLAAQQGDSDAMKKRDEVAAKMDAPALAAAAKALAAFKTSTPLPSANEASMPPGGWDAKPGAPQANRTPHDGATVL